MWAGAILPSEPSRISEIERREALESSDNQQKKLADAGDFFPADALGLVQSPSAIDGGLRGLKRSPFFLTIAL